MADPNPRALKHPQRESEERLLMSSFWGRRLVRYGPAFAATAVSALLRWWLPGALSPAPYLGFYPAVVVAAILGGTGPGLVATFASLLLVNFVFIQFDLLNQGLQLRNLIWVVGGVGVSMLAGWLRSAHRKAEAETAIARAAEAALRESEERWATTLQSIGDAVISTCAAGKITFMNGVAQKLTGWSLSEAKDRPLDEVFNIVQEVTRIKPESPASKVIRLGKVVGLANHTALIRRDGTEIPIEDSGAPIRNREGHIEGVVLVFHDVSEQKKVEKALRSSERLATTGRLAATIAHEIHNPLDAVGNLLYLIDQETSDKPIKDYLSLASSELERVTRMTQQMLTFQRDAAKPVPVRIGDILDSVLALYERKIESAGVKVETKVDCKDDILALPGELRQVFANLIGNAIEATRSAKGKIILRATSSREWKDGRTGVRVVVADSGTGIPAEIRSKIFEPFFTTKGEGGTGLGLWITTDIIRKYGGTLRLWSSARPGRSVTCFSVFIPFGPPSDLDDGLEKGKGSV